jgi:hypothetical protein
VAFYSTDSAVFCSCPDQRLLPLPVQVAFLTAAADEGVKVAMGMHHGLGELDTSVRVLQFALVHSDTGQVPTALGQPLLDCLNRMVRHPGAATPGAPLQVALWGILGDYIRGGVVFLE